MSNNRKDIICVCGYAASSEQDFEQHEIEMAKIEPLDIHHRPR